MLRRRQKTEAEIEEIVQKKPKFAKEKKKPVKVRPPQRAWVDEDESDDDEAASQPTALPSFLALPKSVPATTTSTDDEDESDDDSEAAGAIRRFSVLPPKSMTKSGHSQRIPGLNEVTVHSAGIANKDACPPSRVALTCVKFHPVLRDSLLMTTSLDGSLQLFQVPSGQEEEDPQSQTHHRVTEDTDLLHSHVFSGLRIADATFCNRGDSVCVVGMAVIHMYDMAHNTSRRFRPLSICHNERLLLVASQPLQHHLIFCGGRQGRGYLLDCRSDEAIHSVAVEGDIRHAEFTSLDTLHVASSSSNSIFDLRKLTASSEQLVLGGCGPVPCLGRWSDPGLAVNGAFSLACSGKRGDAQLPEWLACGSAEGYVHLYKYNNVMTAISKDAEAIHGAGSLYHACQPDITLPNLKTVVDSLAFHPSYPLLAFASSREPRALRLYDINKRKVVTFDYASPSPIVCMDFGEQHLAMGARNGAVLMFKCRV